LSIDKRVKDLRILCDFVAIYCQENHQTKERTPFAFKDEQLNNAVSENPLMLCQDCGRLLNHGMVKLMMCPYDPKPMCKKCPTHCYAPAYREKMREVMRFSGMYLIKHGRFDLLFHYLF